MTIKDKIINPDYSDYFAFKAIKSAIVSEISEITASAPVPDNDKINFHIGNPVEDERLQNRFLKLCLKGNEIDHESDQGFNIQSGLNLIRNSIRKSVAYSPRGGYSVKAPPELIEYLLKWFSQEQQEPLDYNVIEKEIIRLSILDHFFAIYRHNRRTNLFSRIDKYTV